MFNCIEIFSQNTTENSYRMIEISANERIFEGILRCLFPSKAHWLHGESGVSAKTIVLCRCFTTNNVNTVEDRDKPAIQNPPGEHKERELLSRWNDINDIPHRDERKTSNCDSVTRYKWWHAGTFSTPTTPCSHPLHRTKHEIREHTPNHLGKYATKIQYSVLPPTRPLYVAESTPVSSPYHS